MLTQLKYKLLLVTLFFLMGCMEQPYAVNNLLCDDDLCWEGIIPSMTLLDDAISILRENGEFEVLSITQNSVSWNSDTYMATLRVNQQGIVYDIFVDFFENEPDINYFIERLGEPSSVNIIEISPGNFTCNHPDIVFDNFGIILTPQLVDNVDGIVESRLITSIRLFSPEQSVSSLNSLSFDWQGFMDYCTFTNN